VVTTLSSLISAIASSAEITLLFFIGLALPLGLPRVRQLALAHLGSRIVCRYPADHENGRVHRNSQKTRDLPHSSG
jgi:hypothetical protein